MIEAGLYSRLKAQVLAVQGRVYPKKLPQGVQYPALTYELVSDPRDHDHGGPSGLVDARYQVTPWSDYYLEMKEVGADVRAALDGFSGAMGTATVANVRHAGGPDLYDPTALVHYGPTDYLIQYTED